MSQPKTKKSAKSVPSITVADVDLRTQAGRDTLDEAIYAHVAASAEPVASGDLLAKLAGSPTQIRRSLGRLRDAGRVVSQGVTRSTRYSAASASA